MFSPRLPTGADLTKVELSELKIVKMIQHSTNTEKSQIIPTQPYSGKESLTPPPASSDECQLVSRNFFSEHSPAAFTTSTTFTTFTVSTVIIHKLAMPHSPFQITNWQKM